MHRFRVLGAVELTGPEGNRIESVMSQPKRLALLALLALEAPRRLQREEVMVRMWPEMSEERARRALRQALHYLRRSLGPGVVAGSGEEGIGIEQEKLECDAAELRRAADEGRFDDVVALYQGELLPGFHLDGAPVEFERWLEEIRRRIRRTAAEAARKLAEHEEAAGNAVAAGAAARKAWELGDWGEPALQELLRLQLRTGDASGALDAYDEFAARLRREHGTEPSAATQEIVRAAAGTPVERSAGGSAPEAGRREPEASGPAGGATVVSRAPIRWWWPAATALAAACLVAVGSLLSRPVVVSPEATVEASAPQTLYLESVRDLGPQGATGRAEAVTDELAAQLSQAAGFRVVAHGAGEGPDASDGIRLRPTLQSSGSEVQLSVLLLDAASDAVLDRVTVEMEESASTTPKAISGRMTPQILEGAGNLLSLRRLAGPGIDPAALDAVRRAAVETEAADGLRVRGATDAAALGYAAADSVLRRAAALNPTWPEPTLRRAELALRAVWLHLIPPNDDPRLAHQEILRGLAHAEAGVASAPESGRAREVRGVLRYWAAGTALDHERKKAFEKAAELDLEEAVRRDPALPRAWSTLSALAEKRGDFAAAYHRAWRAYVTDYDLRVPSDILVRLFTNALEVGDREGAAEWCAEIHRRDPEHWLGPYCDLTHMAWVGPWTVAESDSLVQEGLRRTGTRRSGDAPRRFRLLHAVVLAKAGETAAAREMLAAVEGADSTSPDLLDLQAWVMTALGENERAQQLLATVASLDPDGAPRVLRSRRYADLSSYMLVRGDR